MPPLRPQAKADDLTVIQDAAGLRTRSSRKGVLHKAHLFGVLGRRLIMALESIVFL